MKALAVYHVPVFGGAHDHALGPDRGQPGVKRNAEGDTSRWEAVSA